MRFDRSARARLGDRAELALGRGQLTVLRRAFAAASGLREGLAETGGHRLAYLDSFARFRRSRLLRRGSRAGELGARGEPLVCIHGFGGDKETWLMMTPWLPRRLRTVLLDLPGHGKSSPIDPDAATARRQAGVLAAFLDHLGLDRVILAGNSMGGGIALRFAHDYPDRVRALVLVASVAPVVIANELTAAFDRGENLLVPDSAEKTDSFLRTVTAKPPRVPRAVQRYVASVRVGRSGALDTIFRGWSSAAADDAVPRDLEAIAAPTLVVHGAADRIVHPATADLLAARMPSARRVILDGIGHVPQLEAPGTVARLIAAFVASLALVACQRDAAPTAPPVQHHEEAPVTSTELTIRARWAGPIQLVSDDAGLEALAIRDDAGYDALIARLPEFRVQMKQPAPPSDDPLRTRPPIDFAADMLVVVVRSQSPSPPEIARVIAEPDRLVVRYVVAPPPPEARAYGIGGYAAVQVPRRDGAIELVGPRLVVAEDELAGAVGDLVTLRGPLSRTRIPTLLGVDVEEGSADADRPAEATGWLERDEVSQAELDERLARDGQFAHRGAGTFYRLVAPTGGGLAAARPRR